MVETSPFKTPPAAPVDDVREGRSHPAVLQGRNTSAALIGKRIVTGGQDV
jgi:hypothetical protein